MLLKRAYVTCCPPVRYTRLLHIRIPTHYVQHNEYLLCTYRCINVVLFECTYRNIRKVVLILRPLIMRWKAQERHENETSWISFDFVCSAWKLQKRAPCDAFWEIIGLWSGFYSVFMICSLLNCIFIVEIRFNSFVNNIFPFIFFLNRCLFLRFSPVKFSVLFTNSS